MNTPCWTELVAALMVEPRTERELKEYAGCTEVTVTATLRKMHERGLVRRAGRRVPVMDEEGNHPPGRRPVLWAMQPKPFALADID